MNYSLRPYIFNFPWEITYEDEWETESNDSFTSLDLEVACLTYGWPSFRDVMYSKTYNIYMVRDGNSEWDEKKQYCGWYDAELSPNGIAQAVTSGKALKENGVRKLDVVFISALTRSEQTAQTILNEIGIEDVPIVKSWRLNERHVGALTGLTESEAEEKYGKERVQRWSTFCFSMPPPMEQDHPYYNRIVNDERYKDVISPDSFPNSESRAATFDRVEQYWDDTIAPRVLESENILIVAHDVSLSGVIKKIGIMDMDQIGEVKILPGIAYLYHVDNYLVPLLQEDLQIMGDGDTMRALEPTPLSSDDSFNWKFPENDEKEPPTMIKEKLQDEASTPSEGIEESQIRKSFEGDKKDSPVVEKHIQQGEEKEPLEGDKESLQIDKEKSQVSSEGDEKELSKEPRYGEKGESSESTKIDENRKPKNNKKELSETVRRQSLSLVERLHQEEKPSRDYNKESPLQDDRKKLTLGTKGHYPNVTEKSQSRLEEPSEDDQGSSQDNVELPRKIKVSHDEKKESSRDENKGTPKIDEKESLHTVRRQRKSEGDLEVSLQGNQTGLPKKAKKVSHGEKKESSLAVKRRSLRLAERLNRDEEKKPLEGDQKMSSQGDVKKLSKQAKKMRHDEQKELSEGDKKRKSQADNKESFCVVKKVRAAEKSSDMMKDEEKGSAKTDKKD